MKNGHFATGTVEGTGAAIVVQTGFEPSEVRIDNIDGDCILYWNDAMPADSGMKTVAAGTTAHITSDGVTVYAGTAGGNSAGFTIGADSDINVSAETLVWSAKGQP